MQKQHTVFVLLLVFSFVYFPACNKKSAIPEGMVEVSGKVVFDQSPLVKGVVTFKPAGVVNASSEDVRRIAVIDGEYSLKGGRAIKPGEYSVTINSSRDINKKTKQEATPEMDPTDIVSEELIPAKYNTKSELKAMVSESGPNVFDFDLKK